MTVNNLRTFLLTGIVAGVTACSSFAPTTLFRPVSPHDQYAGSLRTAHLDHTALGADWLAAGNRALMDSLLISIPYRESGYFSTQKPMAVGYRVNAQRGDKLLIRVEEQGQQPAEIFVDVFELGTADPTLVASAKADTSTLVWEVRRTQMHLIRVQPELLRSGRYTISVTREPLLGFPVQGRDSRRIDSYFGDARDGGKRRHEGIDIFAPKGTPALASIDGVISGVGENRLGGNIVWLSDTRHDQRLYYAHLDRFNVTAGQRVAAGDTVGFVGNTGNARTTGPHLHFGVYGGSGVLDPLPFVRLGRGPARQPLLAASRLNDTLRTTAVRTPLRLGPDAGAPVVQVLARTSAVFVAGGTVDWLRVELPGGLTGYIAGNTTETVWKPLNRRLLAAPLPLRDAAATAAPAIKTVSAGQVVEVLGLAGEYQLVRDAVGTVGWVSAR